MLNVVKNIIFIFIVLFLVQCTYDSRDSKYSNDSRNNYDTYEISGKYLTISDTLYRPYRIAVADTTAMIYDNAMQPPLHFVDIKNDKYINGVGGEGSGPGEYESITAMYYDNERSEFMLVDPSNMRKTIYNKGSLIERDKGELFNSITNLDLEGMPLDLLQINNKLLSIGPLRTSERYRYAVLDNKGKKMYYEGKITSGETTGSPVADQMAFRSYGTVNSKDEKIAIASYYKNDIVLYDYNFEVINKMYGHDNFDIEYNLTEDGRFLPNENTRISTIDIVSSYNNIYRLYSGKYASENKSNYGENVEVYNWDGDLLCSIKLDRQLFNIDIGEGNDYLYGISIADSIPGLYKYDLNKSLYKCI